MTGVIGWAVTFTAVCSLLALAVVSHPGWYAAAVAVAAAGAVRGVR